MLRFFDRLNNISAYKNLYDDVRDKKFVAAFGVQAGEKPFVAADIDGFALYVTSDYTEAQRVYRDMRAILPQTAFLPCVDDVLLFKRNASKNTVFERNFVLFSVLKGEVAAVVTTVEALTRFLPEKTQFMRDCFALKKNACYNTEKLAKKLVSVGYSRVDGIDDEGEFVLRGDILDISMPFGKRFHIDFFDDLIEEIKSADGQSPDSLEIFPLYDICGFPEDKLSSVKDLAMKAKVPDEAKARLAEIFAELSLSVRGGKIDNTWLLPFVKSSVLQDYLPKNTVVFWDEPKMLSARVDFISSEHSQRVVNLARAGEAMSVHYTSLVDTNSVFICDKPQISLQILPYSSKFFQPLAIHNFKTGAVTNYAVAADALAQDVQNWKRLGYEIVIFAGADGIEPVSEKLRESGVFVRESEKFDRTVADALILSAAVDKGFVSHTNKLAVVGTRDLGRGLSRQSLSKNKKQAFLSVEKGDYVVHDIHGIGLCQGIEKITSPSGEVKDYISVLYKNGDMLYVPVDASDMLSRYSGGENPPLSRIGGNDFAKVKSKVREGIKEMSVNLLKLYAEREKARGFRYHIDKYLEEEFQQYFPYKATEDQLKCQEEITKDLTSDKIMDRVLVGDVGYGKTEVAMRAAFDVVSNGYQVAVLTPTTILAEQHYATFFERMNRFNIHVECLNRFRTAERQRKILRGLNGGSVDIVIGTHRLLSKDVKFLKLGLLILDEEQRFGVEHKEKLKTLKTNVDVLTLSATPIPRTLHMALSGIRDISTITTPPVERMAVETYVTEESDALIADVISRELARGGQVYCVYNRVETIERFAYKISQLVPQAHIIIAHGQMDENTLEDAVFSFAEGKCNVLVCTTIIENGIDIPNANTVIVCDADRFGLSQLYQIRGRVGRSNRLAYAYFLYRKDKILTQEAYKRLSSITEYSELGSGFKIAMKDLEIRGAGNILGREQHGHMMKVGYEMYARLLKETLAELKGEKPEEKLNTELEIDIAAYAPDDYIGTQSERMDFYRQIASCQTDEELKKIREQTEEIYGVIPQTVENLLKIARLKLLANKASVKKVVVKPGRGEIVFSCKEAMMNKRVFDALSDFGDRATAQSGAYGIVFSFADYMQKFRLLQAIEEFLLKIQPR